MPYLICHCALIKEVRSVLTATMILTPRPVQWGPLCTPIGMGTFPYITALPVGVSARDMASRTLVHQELKELASHYCGPSRILPKAASDKNADQCDHRASADVELVRNDRPQGSLSSSHPQSPASQYLGLQGTLRYPTLKKLI